jgi:hypothetical protein
MTKKYEARFQILSENHIAAIMTASELAEACGVDVTLDLETATVVVGKDGMLDFQPAKGGV